MRIEIDKAAIPYQFDIELVGEVFTFEINYNGSFDFFTVDLLKEDEIIVLGEKIVYGKPLFSSLTDIRLPKLLIIPLNETGETEEGITWENFNETIFLMVGELV